MIICWAAVTHARCQRCLCEIAAVCMHALEAGREAGSLCVSLCVRALRARNPEKVAKVPRASRPQIEKG